MKLNDLKPLMYMAGVVAVFLTFKKYSAPKLSLSYTTGIDKRKRIDDAILNAGR